MTKAVRRQRAGRDINRPSQHRPPDSRVADIAVSSALRSQRCFPSSFYRKDPPRAARRRHDIARALACPSLPAASPNILRRPKVVRWRSRPAYRLALLGVYPVRRRDWISRRPLLVAEFTYLVPEKALARARSSDAGPPAPARVSLLCPSRHGYCSPGQSFSSPAGLFGHPDAAFELFRQGERSAGLHPSGLLMYAGKIPAGAYWTISTAAPYRARVKKVRARGCVRQRIRHAGGADGT